MPGRYQTRLTIATLLLLRPRSDDFEVSIFLTETSTRHSLLYKHKHFRDTAQTKLTSNSTKLTGYSKDAPIDLEKQNDLATAAPFEAQDGTTPVRFLREEDDDDEVVPLHEIPSVDRDDTNAAAEPAPPPAMRPSKRRREPSGSSLRYNRDGAELDDSARNTAQGAGPRRGAANNMVVEDSDDDDLFVTDNDESDAEARYSAGLPVEIDDEDTTTLVPPAKRRKNTALAAETVPEEALRDDKKKLAMDISYEGFSIYGRVLCLVIKRRDGFAGGKGKGKAVATTSATGSTASTTVRGGRGGQSAAPGGQAVMENWITSTQMPADTIAE